MFGSAPANGTTDEKTNPRHAATAVTNLPME
jgi:hypothetical protein